MEKIFSFFVLLYADLKQIVHICSDVIKYLGTVVLEMTNDIKVQNITSNVPVFYK